MGKKSAPRRLSDNEAVATANVMRGSAQKLNLVAGLIRGMKVGEAVTTLAFNQKRIAGEVKKVLQSAIANAENNHSLDVDQLIVAEASVGKAMVLKRFRPRARGRGASIKKPFSKLRIVVREVEETA